MTDFPCITFGIIVLNGEPFIRYTLRALYPYAHEIIVVEGSTQGAKNIATSDGHSRDTTLDTLQQFKAQDDPDNKLIIITKDGFWAEKDEMSQAYAEHATGDYLWQVDVDEFYLPEDIEAVLKMLQEKPSITAISFKTVTFWGAPTYVVDGWYLRRGAEVYHRLFKWSAEYTYVTHRPPTIFDADGQDMRDIHWITADEMEQHGIRMYHYSLLLPKQVIEKCDYYSHAEWAKRQGALEWAHNAYLSLNHPYHVHNIEEYPSWLTRYEGTHPPQMMAMWQVITHDNSGFDIRQTEDVEKLLSSISYKVGRSIIMMIDTPSMQLKALKQKIKSRLARLTPRLIKNRLKSLRR
jgi:glycosyltransferase involved in cell wall biosynthesis